MFLLLFSFFVHIRHYFWLTSAMTTFFPFPLHPPTRQKQKRETLTLIHMKARGNGDSDASGKPRKHKYTHTVN